MNYYCLLAVWMSLSFSLAAQSDYQKFDRCHLSVPQKDLGDAFLRKLEQKTFKGLESFVARPDVLPERKVLRKYAKYLASFDLETILFTKSRMFSKSDLAYHWMERTYYRGRGENLEQVFQIFLKFEDGSATITEIIFLDSNQLADRYIDITGKPRD